jgi:ADP-ribose pyrophosphatase
VKKTVDYRWFKVKWLAKYGWIIERSSAVVVVPIAEDGRVWLAKMHRKPTDSTSWELPGGGAERGEDVVTAGLRELEEECGLVASRGGRLHTVLELAPGMGRFPHHVVVAQGVKPKGRRAVPQVEESISAVKCFDQAQVQRMIVKGTVSVGATLAGLVACGWLGAAPPRSRRTTA